jgi:hypothetical protein
MGVGTRSWRGAAAAIVVGFFVPTASCTAATRPARTESAKGDTLANARNKAEAIGSARLIVTVSQSSETAGGLEVEATKATLLRRLGKDVLSSRSILGTPHLVVELKPAGIVKLGRERMVADVQDDVAESPQ